MVLEHTQFVSMIFTTTGMIACPR